MALNDLLPWRGGRTPAMHEQDPFGSLQREMNRLFESFWGGVEPRMGLVGGTAFYSPTVDVHETDQAYRVAAELPGLSEGDVEINLRDNNLIIAGEKKTEHREKHLVGVLSLGDAARVHSPEAAGMALGGVATPVSSH